MSKFGELIDPISPTRARSDYAVRAVKLKRVGLASFLCGVAACMMVSLIAIAIAFIYSQLSTITALPTTSGFDSGGLLTGATMATFMAALNWYVGYITIPVAWLVLGLSLGRFPRRNIIRPAPYYRWGAIWGGVLVGATSSIATGLISGWQAMSIIGALFTGTFIGVGAGLTCGWLFLAIVRPSEQVAKLEVDVF